MRQARDGHFYTQEQFMTFYGARGDAMWNEANRRGAAEPAGAPAGAVLGPSAAQAVSEPPPGNHSLPADEGAHLAEPSPAQPTFAPCPPSEPPPGICGAAEPAAVPEPVVVFTQDQFRNMAASHKLGGKAACQKQRELRTSLLATADEI